MIEDIIGYVATAVTTISLLPQVAKTWKTKSAKDISYGMCFLGILGGIFWTTYGILFSSLQIIIANTFVFICFSIILVLKLKLSNET